MTPPPVASSPRAWATSAFGEPAETSPTHLADLADLGAHMTQCTPAHRRLAALQCSALQMRGFVMGRLVTCLLLALALGMAVFLWL